MQRIKQNMLMRTLVNYCNWTLIFNIIVSWHFFCTLMFFFLFFFCPWALQAACENWVEWDSESEAGEVPGTWTSTSEALWACGDLTVSPECTLIYPIHVLPGNHPPTKDTLALRGQAPGALVAASGQHFSDHRPLWWDDSLSLTSPRVLVSVAQPEVEDRGPAVVLRSHYRQTEPK